MNELLQEMSKYQTKNPYRTVTWNKVQETKKKFIRISSFVVDRPFICMRTRAYKIKQPFFLP